MLHASLALNVLVCERKHPSLCTLPSLCDTVGTPHASVADALPSAALIVAADGLQPNEVEVPPDVSAGGVKSILHVTVLDVLEVLPHASLAFHLLVCERVHSLEITAPSLCVKVGVLQASLAVAVPNAATTVAAVGLQPAFSVVPPAVIVGGVRSAIQVTVLEAVEVLLHTSLAVNLLVWFRLHPLLTTGPSD